MQASQAVVAHAGGSWNASLNHFDTGGGCMVTMQQIDELVYVVGQDSFDVARYSLSEWVGELGQADPPTIECDDAGMTWELLQVIREDCQLWQCGACDAWIFTSNRPRVGILRCGTCRTGGIDFRHADRHVGAESGDL